MKETRGASIPKGMFKLKPGASAKPSREAEGEVTPRAGANVLEGIGLEAAGAEEGAPYSCPVAFLPADSIIRTLQTAPRVLARAKNDPARAELGNTAREAAALAELLRRHVISGHRLTQELARLRGSVARAHGLLETELSQLARPQNGKAGRDASGGTLRGRSKEEARGYVIYDAYFNVVRLPSMTSEQFAAQFTSTCLALLNDLPHALLQLEHLAALAETMSMALDLLAKNFCPGVRVSRRASEAKPSADTGRQLVWPETLEPTPDGEDEWTRRAAFYRWRVGHHFFNLCSILCRQYLERAAAALKKSGEGEAAELISMASQCLRGGTAAMCYAGNFPSRIYQNHIRPSMIMTETPHGFSGSQNADRNHLRAARSHLQETVFNYYGRETDGWPALVYSAMMRLHEAEVEDCEHHVLLAAAKVGADSSLSQKVWQARLPPGAKVKNAVDVLRDMAEIKRREYKF